MTGFMSDILIIMATNMFMGRTQQRSGKIVLMGNSKVCKERKSSHPQYYQPFMSHAM